MAEIGLLAIGLALAALWVLGPLWSGAEPSAPPGDEGAAIRHRVALEALRDIDADHAAGLTDEATYAAQLAEAEGEAAATRAALDAAPEPARVTRGGGRRLAIVTAIAIGLALTAGSAVEWTGLANATVVNQPLADARAAEAARQARISELLSAIAADPADAGALSELADLYLAGSTPDDLARAAAALQLLIAADPGRADAYERLMSAYLRAGDYANGRAVHDDYAGLSTADPLEVAFFDGLIALRGEDDPERALAAFDTFLELAPDDPRAGMIRGLRDEAAAAAGSPAP
jgi:hypothetical protein